MKADEPGTSRENVRLSQSGLSGGVRRTIASQQSRRIPALDGLRGIAILLVMVFHFMSRLPDGALGGWISEIAATGWVGVDLFFVLSGFLITGLLLDAKGAERFFRTFYARRSLRIFPLYFGLLAAEICLVPLLGISSHTAHLAQQDQGWLWLYAANILVVLRQSMCLGHLNHLWSLAIEEHFYLVWPLVVYWCGPRALKTVCLAGIAVAVFARLVCFTLGFEFYIEAAYVLTLCRIDSLCVGALLAAMVRETATLDEKTTVGARERSAARLWPSLSAVSLVTLVSVFNLQGGAYRGDWFWGVLGYTLIAVVCAGAVFAALPGTPGLFPTVLRTVCSTPVLRMFGKYSYGLYLFHYVLLPPVTRLVTPGFFMRFHLGVLPSAVCCLAAWIAICLVPAIASWHLFERWFVSLGPIGRSGAVREVGLNQKDSAPAIDGELALTQLPAAAQERTTSPIAEFVPL